MPSTPAEFFAARQPDVGTFLPDAVSTSLAVWLPQPDEEGLVIVGRNATPRGSDTLSLIHDQEMLERIWASPMLKGFLTYFKCNFAATPEARCCTFPSSDTRNRLIGALALPDEHRIPLSTPYDGEGFPPHEEVAELAITGKLLHATKGFVAVHDMLNHAFVQSFLTPGHMARLQANSRLAMEARAQGNNEQAVAVARKMEHNLSIEVAGSALAVALEDETEATLSQPRAQMGQWWRLAAEYFNYGIRHSSAGVEPVMPAEVAALRDHCAVIFNAIRRAQAWLTV